MEDTNVWGGLTGGKALELGQKQESWIKQALCGSHCHSESQEQSRDREGEVVRHAWFQTRHLRCISAAKSQDHCMYHGSSCATRSGGNTAYTEAKQSVIPFNKKGEHNMKPGELTHIDVWGKYDVASINNFQYYLLLVDDASRYVTVEFLKSKDQVA